MEETMPKGDQKTGIKEAQRKALRQKAYERDTKVDKARAKQVGKLASVKASARNK
jgi:hypothetical protein